MRSNELLQQALHVRDVEKDTQKAQKLFAELITRYPHSEAAELARAHLYNARVKGGEIPALEPVDSEAPSLPTKRYVAVLVIVGLFWVNLTIQVLPPSRFAGTRSGVDYLWIAVDVGICLYFILSVLGITFGRRKAIEVGPRGLTGWQKTGITLVHAGWGIVVLASAVMAIFLVIVSMTHRGDGMSGVPFGIALSLGVLIWCLAVLLLEIGHLRMRWVAWREAARG